jgi:hypothetical protein
VLGAARLAFKEMSKPAASTRFRDGAEVVIIILTDGEDKTSGMNSSIVTQSKWEPVGNFVSFFGGPNPTNARGTVIPVHAIYCPAGKACGDDPVPATVPTRIQAVVQATGGLLGDILQPNVINEVMRNIVEREIGKQGIELQRPFIGASLRMALESPTGACNVADVSRSRESGFDYDGMYQSVSFFGSCRPIKGSEVVVSYQSWEPWTLD